MITDVYYEEFIGRCARCSLIYFWRNHYTNSFGVSLVPCSGQETDADLRKRVAKASLKSLISRGPCNGRVHRVDNHDAVLSAFKLGGEQAALQILEAQLTQLVDMS